MNPRIRFLLPVALVVTLSYSLPALADNHTVS